MAKRSAEPSHSHPEGIKGAQAVAVTIFLARAGASKDKIKSYVEVTFHYMLDESLDSIRAWYRFERPARVRFHRQSGRSWNRTTLRTRSARRYP